MSIGTDKRKVHLGPLREYMGPCHLPELFECYGGKFLFLAVSPLIYLGIKISSKRSQSKVG